MAGFKRVGVSNGTKGSSIDRALASFLERRTSVRLFRLR